MCAEKYLPLERGHEWHPSVQDYLFSAGHLYVLSSVKILAKC